MSGVTAIAAVELRRFLRDRANIFFVFVFPLLIVLLVGSQFGGSGEGRAAVAGDESDLRTALVEQLEAENLSVSIADADSVREQLARGRSDVGLFISPGAERAFEAGQAVDLEVVASAQQGSPATLQRVRTAVQAMAAEAGQVAALTAAGLTEDEAGNAIESAAVLVSPPRVEVVDVNRISQEFEGLGKFDLGAAGQTLLFVFLSSLAGSATMIQTRRNGVMARTLAAPVSTAQAVGGQALGRFTIAAFQGAYIMVATALFFQVSWGSVWLSLLVLTSFAVVAAGAAMLIGSLVDNDQTASGVGVGLGLVLAALGGCMVPLEIFPATLRSIAHITPHAWAYDAFAKIQRHDASLVDVLPQLGVLAAMAVTLLALGAWALQRSMSRAM